MGEPELEDEAFSKPSDEGSGGKEEATVTETNKKAGKPITEQIRAYRSIISFLKYFGGGFLMWSCGRWGIQYYWLLSGIFSYTLWKCYRKDKTRGQAEVQEIVDPSDTSRRKDLPSWVFFPDVERAEWLNKFIAQLWPYVNEMVIKILKETVEPQIQKSVPGFLKSIQFTEISLGNRPPRVGGIKVYTENVKRSEVIMDIDLIYSGDADFELSVKSITVGIEDLQVRGTLRVIMSPLVPASPLVAGLSVFFLDKPELDFDLTNLLNILDIPGLSDILRGAISDVIASFCVLPNRISIPLLSDVGVFDLRYPMPKGVLRIEVIEGRDLEKKDIGFLKKGSADPFVVVKVGADSFKTDVKKNNLTPVWNEVFECFVDHPHGQKLKLCLYDYDKTSDNESMGYIEMDISTIAARGISDVWLPLEDTSSGELHVKCTWFILSDDPKDLMCNEESKEGKDAKDMLATAALFVKLDSAKNLPVVNQVKRSTSAMCKLTMGNKTVESQVVDDNLNPVWDEFHRFLVFNAKYQELNIEVIDNNKERPIGQLEIPLSSIVDETGMSSEQPFPLKDSGHDSALVCEVKLRALVNRKVKYDVCGEEEPCEVDAVQAVASTAETIKEAAPVSQPSVPAAKPAEEETVQPIPPAPKSESEEKVRHRKPAPSSPPAEESKAAPGEFCGEIELSITFKDKTLAVDVIRARKLIACDSDGLADPYVRLYLLPDKSKSSRRKTDVVKNSLAPDFNETFHWSVEKDEISERTLEVIVKNDVSFFSRSRTTMGRAEVKLTPSDLDNGVQKWFTLFDEPDSD